MSPARSWWLLLLPSLGGCWPWIPGSWDDYYVPEDVRILGAAESFRYLGGYWADGSPDHGADVWWGWLAQPEPDADPLEILAPQGLGCHRGRDGEERVQARFADPGAGVATVSGPHRELSLSFYPYWGYFYGETESLPAGVYSLEPLSGQAAGPLEVATFFEQPDTLPLHGPPLDGAQLGTIPIDGLSFSWDPDSDAARDADYVVVQLGLTEGGGAAVREWVSCAAETSEGAIDVPVNLWEDPDAWGVFVLQYTVRSTLSRIGEREISSGMLGTQLEIGFVKLE